MNNGIKAYDAPIKVSSARAELVWFQVPATTEVAIQNNICNGNSVYAPVTIKIGKVAHPAAAPAIALFLIFSAVLVAPYPKLNAPKNKGAQSKNQKLKDPVHKLTPLNPAT